MKIEESVNLMTLLARNTHMKMVSYEFVLAVPAFSHHLMREKLRISDLIFYREFSHQLVCFSYTVSGVIKLENYSEMSTF